MVVGILLQLIGPIKVLPALGWGYFLQWLGISGILLGAVYGVKFGANYLQARKERQEREVREALEKKGAETEKKGLALIYNINTLVSSSWSRRGDESVRGTYIRLVLEGLCELDLSPWQLLDPEAKFPDGEFEAYLIEIRSKLNQGVEEAQKFAQTWNRRR